MSARDATESIEQLLLSLEQLEQGHLKGKEDDLAFLRNMLQTPEFQSLLKVHNAVSEGTRETFAHPVSPSAVTLANMVAYDAEGGSLQEERELHSLLSSPHISALLTTHDKVANKEYPLQSVAATEIEEGSVSGPIRVVYVEKKKEPLGATVRCDENKQIVISRVLSGSVVSRSGVLHSGDVVHEINDKPIGGWSIDQVADFMQTLCGTIKFKISPAIDEFTAKKRSRNSFHIRSLVVYHPKDDRHHPCQEAGLSLELGEMVRVVDQQDPEWWQAMKVGAGQQGVGLIPSKKYMEWIRTYSSTKKKRRDKSKDYNIYDSELLGRELATYEEMTRVEPQPGRPRPIMLIAPRNGPFTMEDLKQKLLSEDTAEQFGSPIPHTSRPLRSGEVNGKEYFFIRRSQIERDILNGEMVEHAILNGHYYGTSMNSIRRIMSTGKTCLLLLDPQAIKLARNAEIRPFIVYFTTPTADFMKKNWVPIKKIKDSSVLDVVRQATHLEKNYGHYFDHYIPFEDIDSAHKDIVTLATNLQTNQQWVPSTWVKTTLTAV